MDLDGVFCGGVEQTVDTEAGRTFPVTFDVADNPENEPFEKPMRVSAISADPAHTAFTDISVDILHRPDACTKGPA